MCAESISVSADLPISGSSGVHKAHALFSRCVCQTPCSKSRHHWCPSTRGSSWLTEVDGQDRPLPELLMSITLALLISRRSQRLGPGAAGPRNLFRPPFTTGRRCPAEERSWCIGHHYSTSSTASGEQPASSKPPAEQRAEKLQYRNRLSGEHRLAALGLRQGDSAQSVGAQSCASSGRRRRSASCRPSARHSRRARRPSKGIGSGWQSSGSSAGKCAQARRPGSRESCVRSRYALAVRVMLVPVMQGSSDTLLAGCSCCTGPGLEDCGRGHPPAA